MDRNTITDNDLEALQNIWYRKVIDAEDTLIERIRTDLDMFFGELNGRNEQTRKFAKACVATALMEKLV